MTQPGNYNANVVLSADISNYQQAMAQAGQATDQTTTALGRLGQVYDNTKSRMRDRIVTYDRATIATLAASTAAAAQFQKQLATLSATAAVTGNTSMRQLKSGIESAFLKFPVSRTEIVQLTTAISQMGVTSVRDINSMTQTFTKLAAVTGGTATSLAAAMTQFTNAMGDESAGNVKAMSNSLVNLSKNAGVSAQSVLDFSQAIAPIARVSGITENQVLGLATAFTKAGANGYVAANTFNSMLQDITQLSSTGSPQLAKYANVLGMTVAQFNNLPRAQAVAQLFQTINSQGSQGINTLNQLGINGVRAITALQSVVSQGDLSQLASGGNTTNNALDKGAKAAFGGLADQLAVTRNEFTQYGTVIGTTFLTPMTGAVKVTNQLIQSLGFLKPLMGISTAAIGALGGLATSVIAPLLALAGPLIAMRWIRRGPVGGGLAGGFQAGRLANNPEGLEAWRQAQLARGMRPNQVYPDQMGAVRGGFFRPGAAAGSFFARARGQDVVSQSIVRGAANMAVTSPFRLIRTFADANRNYYANSMAKEGFDTPRLDRLMSSMNLRQRFAAGRAFNEAAQEGSPAMAPGGMVHLAGRLKGQVDKGAISTERALEILQKQISRSTEALMRNTEALSTDQKMAAALAEQAGMAARALATLTGTTIKASASAVLGGLGALPGSAPVRAVGRFGAGLGKELFSSPLMGVMTAGMIGYGAYSMANSQSKKSASWEDFLNPIQKYNEQLGIATTQLAKFGSNLDQSGAKATLPTSMAAAITPSALNTDRTSAPSKPSITAFKSLKKGDTGQAVALLKTLPMTTPGQLQLAAQDLFASGWTMDQVSSAMSQYVSEGTNATGLGKGAAPGQSMDFKSLANQVSSLEGRGQQWAIGPTRSKRGKAISASVLTALDLQKQSDTQQFGGKFAGLSEFGGASNYFGQLLGNYGAATGTKATSLEEELARSASKLTGGGYGGYHASLGNGKVKLNEHMTEQERTQAFADLLKSTDKGRQWLKNNGVMDDKGNINQTLLTSGGLKSAITDSMNLGNGATMSSVGSQSALGGAVLGNAQVQAVAGGSQRPSDINKSIQYIADSAIKTSHSLEDADNQIVKFIAATGNATGPLGQLAAAARTVVQQMMAARAPMMSPVQQFQTAGTILTNAQNADPNSEDYGKNLDQARANEVQQVQSQQQMLKSIYETTKSYNKQISDADADMYHQRNIMIRDFGISQTQANEDYHKQVRRSNRDFAIQLQRQAESSAQSIYNPFLRVQAQYTTDAGTLLQNLADQNQRIAQQQAQLVALRKRGVSQQAIDTLDLANPNNAQQLNNIVNSLTPDMIAKLNALVAQRMAGTKSLTQSTFSKQFREATADFKRQMADASQDFQTGMDRARQAQDRALGDLATSFGISMARSQRDLNDSMTTMLGSYENIWGLANKAVRSELSKTAPAAAKTIEDLYLNPLTKDPLLRFLIKIAGVYGDASLDNMLSVTVADKNSNPSPTAGGSKPKPPSATGGIAYSRETRDVGEAGPEMILPLNYRSHQFMVDMYRSIGTTVARQLQGSGAAHMPGGAGMTYNMNDYSTRFMGEIKVYANDTKQFLAEIQKKKRLDRLSKPAMSASPLASV